MYSTYSQDLYELNVAIENANRCIEAFVPMSAKERFFEDGEDKDKDTPTKEKTEGFLKKAIDALKKFIENLMNRIKDFMTRLSMSKEKQMELEKFKEMIRKNPEFANAKITVQDVEKIKAAYQKSLDYIDKAIADIEAGRVSDLAAKEKEVKDTVNKYVSGVVKGTTSVITTHTLVKIMERNRNIAKIIYKKLEDENSMVSKMAAALGEKEAKKFKADAKGYASAISLRRLKSMILGRYHENMSDALKSSWSDFQHLVSKPEDFKDALGKVKHLDIVDKTLGAINNTFGTNITKGKVVGGIVKGAVTAGKAGYKAKKAKDDAGDMIGFLVN